MPRSKHVLATLCLQLTMAPFLIAGPTVIPTSEGQLGVDLGSIDEVVGGRFEAMRGGVPDGLTARMVLQGGNPPPLPEVQFLSDMIHDYPDPVPISSTPFNLTGTSANPPRSARSPNAANTGDFVAFSSTSSGTAPGTIGITITNFDDTDASLSTAMIDNIPTFPDPSFTDTGLAVDNQGRVTVAYTELENGQLARVKAQRFDGITGLTIGAPIDIAVRLSPDIALLDPAGNRLIIASSDFAGVSGNILDLSGATPTVSGDFPISTTPGNANIVPQIATNMSSGESIAVWENLVDLPGDPVNVRARRFDAMGNPIGDDFIVNQTTTNAQGQPAVAMNTMGLAAVAWAGDSTNPGDSLDVFTQVFDPNGNPIGGEIKVNTFTSDLQDRPAVNFLPMPDSQGRPQFMVTWRDVENASGTEPRNTGLSYRCFSIEGFEDPTLIFADGFEDGDTTSWSASEP